MPDPYRKGRPGGRAKMAAELQNRLVEMAQDFVSERGFSQQEISTPQSKLRVVNLTGDPLYKYAVVGLGAPMASPMVDFLEWRGQLGFYAADPAEGASFAILQEDCPNELAVDALATGETHCWIDILDVNDTFAGPVDGDYDKLTSDQFPVGAEILFANIPTDGELNVAIADNDILLVVSDASMFTNPDQTAILLPFVVTIDDEDILVTDLNAPDNQTWGIERGHNGTTAASHDAAAAITFTSGTVWGTVRLAGRSADDSDNLAVILAAVSMGI